MLDTGDIVQTVAMKAIRQLNHIDQQVGSLSWYLRQAIRNEIASQWRKAGRAPLETTFSASLPAADTSPLERLLKGERLAQFDAALERLDASDRDVIHGRFELGYDYEELARYLGKASAATARVAVHRAIKRLVQVMPPPTAIEGAGPAPLPST
jgi:RNA polymerase sigma factor (sigma-70 family)